MEAAVSAYAVNSKLWLWLGLGRWVGGGWGGVWSSKQSLSLSIGVGCCNWSSRKRNNITNCTRGVRLESTLMGMRPSPTIERQSFNLNGRFVRDEAASALGGEDIVENGDVMLPHATINFAIQYVRPACLGLAGVMFRFGYYLQSKITNAFVEAAIVVGLIVATKLLGELKELQHSCDRNRNFGGGSLTSMVSLTSVLQHVGLACLTVVVTMLGLGYILSYMSPSGITSVVLNAIYFVSLG
ncbi:hypothetical protein OROMI_007165 [Orobanche minor]